MVHCRWSLTLRGSLLAGADLTHPYLAFLSQQNNPSKAKAFHAFVSTPIHLHTCAPSLRTG